MTSAKSSSELSAMRSDYNRYSQAQLQLFNLMQPYIAKAVDVHSAQLPSQTPLIIADFGCSTGANSSTAMSTIIANMRQKYGHDKTASVLVVLEDLPRNNWTELFNYIHNDASSFLKLHNGTSAVATGLSFYDQILPNNCLHVAFSHMALHWCTDLPIKLANHYHTLFASTEEANILKKHAAKDWATFLRVRSAELVKGGVLVASIVPRQEEALKTFDAVYRAAVMLSETGRITQQELLDFNMRQYCRSVEEVTDSPLLQSLGLEVVVAEKYPPVNTVFYDAYLNHQDAGLFAEELGNNWMAFVEPSFVDGLSPSRTDEEKKDICALLWRNFKDLVKATPNEYAKAWGAIFVVLRKI